MRYYAEWLDGEYFLLKHTNNNHRHDLVMERSLKLHALFGSTIVLSDAQTIDIRTPITKFFLDSDFRHFLQKHPNFLALAAEPVRGANDRNFAIAMKGIERLSNQANRPPDSFEEAIAKLGEPIFRAGYFDAERYLDPGLGEKGGVGRVIGRFPQYASELKGLLHVVDYFSRSPLRTTTTPSMGIPERYDTLLKSVLDNVEIVDEQKATRIQEILRIQEEQLPEAQHGRRAAIRKVLGTGRWHAEEWTPENLRLYLDVVHAWNCAINQAVAPEAGTLCESRGDIQLSKHKRTVTDAIDWSGAGPMPTGRFSNPILRFLSWDPIDTDWKHISRIADKTRESAEILQAALRSNIRETWISALEEHASNIASCLVDVPTKEIPEWCWNVLQIGANLTDIVPSEYVDIAKEVAHDAPQLWAGYQRWEVVNTVADIGPELLKPRMQE